jgi:Trk K+ transport system NAD-binding subunit
MRHPTGMTIMVRYLGFLLYTFRWPLLVFWSLVFIGGFFVQWGYQQRELDYLEACYDVFLLIFLESALEFPERWYLRLAFFALPIIGLGAVADSLVRLGYLTFATKRKLPEWNQMLASAYRDHVIVVGVGRVGVSIVHGLLDLHEPVVAIEKTSDSLFLDEIRERKVPIITGNGRHAGNLEKAGVRHARSIILAANDDLANLDGALTARELNPEIHVVLRMFDNTLANKVSGAFSLPVISPAQVSAASFIAAATERKVFQTFQLDGQTLHLIEYKACPSGGLVGRSVGELQSDRKVNVVMHKNAGGVDVNPHGENVIEAEDTILVIAPMDRLRQIEAANQPSGNKPRWLGTSSPGLGID